MSELLSSLRERTFVGVRELADAAERVLRDLGSSQGKETVTEFPNERTIRFYNTEGLLPPPIDTKGTASVYGYEHILVLLTIKKLQAEGLPISIIKTLIVGKSTDELEQMFGERVMVFTDPAELKSLIQTSGREEGEEILVLGNAAARDEYLAAEKKKNRATEFLESLLFARPSRQSLAPSMAFSRPPAAEPELMQSVPPPASMAPMMQPPPAAREQMWRRIEIEPGLELHIDSGYCGPATRDGRNLLIKTIERILRHLH